MRHSVLVITPSDELGELISTSLRETRQFQGYHFTNPDDAVAFLAAHRDAEYAIIETQIGESRVIEVGHSLRRLKRDIKLVLIARSRPGRGMDEIQPWRLLRQPFLLPELFAALGASAPAVIDVQPARAPASSRPTWLEDPSLASRTLERLTRTTDIQEALILREADLWASAGRLSSASVREIADMILETMGYDEQFDLLRFMRLRSMDAQHGVWAKLLLVNVILAVIYDLDTPISQMRSQANALADALSRPLLARPRGTGDLDLPRTTGETAAPARTRRPRPADEPPTSSLSILDETNGAGREYGRQASREQLDEEPLISRRVPPRPRRPAREADEPLPAGTPRSAAPGRVDDQEFLIHAGGAVADAAGFDEFGILYSCLLTPRFDTQPLTGHLAALLQRRLPRICISYGWRLESVDVMHDCLQWSLRVPPTEAIAGSIDAVRKMTSQYIFEEFPELLRENLSRDFWAPGFSVKAGAKPHTPEQVRAYVSRTRRGVGQSPLEDDNLAIGDADDWGR